MLRDKLTSRELKIIGIVSIPFIITITVLFVRYIHEIKANAALQHQICYINSIPMYPTGEIKTKIIHMNMNMALLQELLNNNSDNILTKKVWVFTYNLSVEIGQNLVAFSPKEKETVNDFFLEIQDHKTFNQKSLDVLSGYINFLTVAFGQYIALQ